MKIRVTSFKFHSPGSTSAPFGKSFDLFCLLLIHLLKLRSYFIYFPDVLRIFNSYFKYFEEKFIYKYKSLLYYVRILVWRVKIVLSVS